MFKRERKRERDNKPESNSSESKNTQTTCPECSKTIQPNTDYLNFCSEQCYLKHYGSLCPLCNKYDTTAIYWDKEKYPSLTYCLDCYEKELKRKQENETKSETSQESLVDKCIMNETHCEFCGIELPNRRFFPVCDKDECKRKFWKKGEKQESKQDDSMSREIKKREPTPISQAVHTQSTMTNIKNLFQQYLNLAQVAYGSNSTQYQELVRKQQEDMAILEKALEEEQKEYLDSVRKLRRLLEKNKSGDLSFSEQKRISKLSGKADEFIEKLKKRQVKTEQKAQQTRLIMWIGGGLLGVGLIGLVVWLIMKGKNK